MRLHTKADVYLLLYSAIPAAALGAAIETGLLWRLAVRPMSALEIAQALTIPGKRCHYWLQVLVELGLLEHGPAGYTPSALAHETILATLSQTSRQHLALDERERTTGVQALPLFIHEPGSIWAAQGLAEPEHYVDKMRADPARAREFTRMLLEVHQHLADEVADLIDMTGVERIMDLGGGSGVVSMALLRRNAGLSATVVDIEPVCVAGRDIAEEAGLSDRISYHAADFADGQFPTGFDLVLQCDVGISDVALFQKAWQSLKPAGRLILVDHFAPADTQAPLSCVEWTFADSLRDPDIGFPTLDQARAQLAQAGFDILPDCHTLRGKMIMLQARKKGTVVGP